MILTHCRLIPELSGGVRTEDGMIICENGKIKAVLAQMPQTEEQMKNVLKRENMASVDDTDIIDCSGMTVIPGLIDAHTHMACLRDYDPVQLKDPMNFFMNTAKRSEHYLDYGFTTIRDCGTPLRVAGHVRDSYQMGLGNGPRILACGLILSPTEIEEQDSLREIYEWTDGVDSCTRAARRELAQHADFVKVMASGSALHPQGIPVQPIIFEEEMRAITRVTDLKGSYVAAHAHGDGAIRLCVDTGVRTIEHASFISEETIEALLKRNAAATNAGFGPGQPCYLIPTLSAMYQNPDTTPASWYFLVEKLQKMLEISAGCIEKAYKAGCPMGFGTDSFWAMEQYERGLEFRFRSEYCHMANTDILLQATKINAQAIGLSDVCGEIREGLAAEFCLIDGKPDRDISVLYRKPARVCH